MVTTGGALWRDQSGKSRLGGLLTLLFLAALAYYGYGVGGYYIQAYQMEDEMQSQASLAPGLDDAVIRRRLVAKADALGLPPDAHKFVIRRTARPREIVISTSWEVILELPFYAYPVTFRPEVRAPL